MIAVNIYSLSPWLCAQCFSCTISLNPHNKGMKVSAIIIPF